ncbi:MULTISPECIES: hypothetical protein [Gordonia]|uniref:Uncharacterized protein n=1 Tax=Gordonia sihwensis NBRC 108236 TaxID=1223544 RepID=L7LGW5_9ACTN|nr:hypothetical protein [Gordonia sihwensis]WFN93442.1 hypothetical protein P5P27_02390 [Gordonia sihwensis]GAC59308.1 hypothetical protein GSI01S_01_02740 [Gordonia sihwensis NBRC 108236]
MSVNATKCKTCGQPIRWWRSSVREGGWLCVDYSPDDAGTVKRVPTLDPATRKRVMYGRALTGTDLAAALADGELLFTLHSRTCHGKKAHSAEQ